MSGGMRIASDDDNARAFGLSSNNSGIGMGSHRLSVNSTRSSMADNNNKRLGTWNGTGNYSTAN